MKKILVVLMVLAIAVSIAACKKETADEDVTGGMVTMDAEDISNAENGTNANSEGEGKNPSAKDGTTKKGEQTTTAKADSGSGKKSASDKKDATEKGATKKDSSKKSDKNPTVTDTKKYETPIMPLK